MPDDQACQVCGAPKDNHPYRHPFVGFGKDPELKLPPPQKPPQATPVINPAIDAILFRLIQLLVKKGLVTGDELAVLLGARPGPSGDEDRGAGAKEVPDGGSGLSDRRRAADRAPE